MQTCCCWAVFCRVSGSYSAGVIVVVVVVAVVYVCVPSVSQSRSREFMREKAEKRALEERISVLQSQIVTGGGASVLKDSPAFRNAVKEHQERVRQEYEARLHDLEKVRTRAFDFAIGHPAIGQHRVGFGI